MTTRMNDTYSVMKKYTPSEIEPKWQKVWEDTKIYEVGDDVTGDKRYIMEYFPYPSGAAMHVGHVRNYVIGDAMVRHERMLGRTVLHPMGWDSFGLPAENYAIKTGISPRQAIDENTAKFKQQLTQMGFSYDWSREIDSSDPNYYKWTQWFFLMLHRRGLAYRKESLQWWCPTDKTVLANEQVEDGKCWRCGNEVIKKPLKQWFFKITDYADRLAEDLDKLDWSDALKSMQRNWIGRKTGIEIIYRVDDVPGEDENIICFTTRPDTNFGATFIVLAPEHPFAKRVASGEIVPKGKPTAKAVVEYIEASLAKSEIDRQMEGRTKTGVFTGFYVHNGLNGEKLPVYISDFVLANFGTGAVVGVPGHDVRDFEFAQVMGIPVKRVVVSEDGDTSEITTSEQVQESNGKMINSGFLDGMLIQDAIEAMMDHMEAKGFGKRITNYRIRDWLISRQRYWGAPIPIVFCETCGEVPVAESDLPIKLPDLDNYQPAEDGRSPLARVEDWVNTTCPTCKGPAKRETDTMDGFACSSWYFLRFADPKNNEAPFDPEKAKFWLPVDSYIGGAEHAVMHLLYARFWTKVMFDDGLIDFDEPFTALRNHGMILAPDSRKMSKSYGNVIAPDDLISQGYGADSIRLMELFIGPWNQEVAWNVNGISGTYRFLQRVWTLVHEYLEVADDKSGASDPEKVVTLSILTQKAIKKVTQDLEGLRFNTAIACIMELVNDLNKLKTELPLASASQQWRTSVEHLVQLLAPFAPHISEELWHELGHDDSVHTSAWPTWDESLIHDNLCTIVIQVNGKVRGNMQMAVDSSESEVVDAAKAMENVAKFLTDKAIAKTIHIPNKLINFVIR